MVTQFCSVQTFDGREKTQLCMKAPSVGLYSQRTAGSSSRANGAAGASHRLEKVVLLFFCEITPRLFEPFGPEKSCVIGAACRMIMVCPCIFPRVSGSSVQMPTYLPPPPPIRMMSRLSHVTSPLPHPNSEVQIVQTQTSLCYLPLPHPQHRQCSDCQNAASG